MVSALVAYNWGPENARKWIEDGEVFRSLPAETRQYIFNVFENRKSMGSG